MPICRDCKKELSEFLFGDYFEKKSGMLRKHTICINCQANLPDGNRLRDHGLSLGEKKQFHVNNGSCCAICGSIEKLVVDHCHISNELRGSLCANCNSGLGYLQDSIALLEKAIKYLQKYPPKFVNHLAMLDATCGNHK